MAKEADIITAKLELQWRRTDYETEKASLEKDLSSLKTSLKAHQQIDKDIKRSKLDVDMERFYEIERANDTIKIQQEQFHKVHNAMTLFLKSD